MLMQLGNISYLNNFSAPSYTKGEIVVFGSKSITTNYLTQNMKSLAIDLFN